MGTSIIKARIRATTVLDGTKLNLKRTTIAHFLRVLFYGDWLNIRAGNTTITIISPVMQMNAWPFARDNLVNH